MRTDIDSIQNSLFRGWLISSDLVKWFTATLTETEELRNDLYIIRISFATILCEYRAGDIELS